MLHWNVTTQTVSEKFLLQINDKPGSRNIWTNADDVKTTNGHILERSALNFQKWKSNYTFDN